MTLPAKPLADLAAEINREHEAAMTATMKNRTRSKASKSEILKACALLYDPDDVGRI